jgi:feruloyl esterase
MRRHVSLVACCFLALALHARAQPGACAKLTSQHFPHTRIHSARNVAAGPFIAPREGPFPTRSLVLPAFCRVKGDVDPHIGFEIWLPEQGWNGRLLALGSGGFGGFIDDRQLASMMKKGYAVTANDTGHTGQGYAWMHDPVARRAWGHSATHDVIGPMKEIVRAFYKRGPAYSYFDGCSTGGAQAMEEAEFYPDDFNGIVAGSPGMDYSHLMLSFLWGLKSSTEHATLNPQKIQLLNRAVMKQCDAADGVKDGLVENPLACHFHPEKLLCKGKNTNACLTGQEVKTAELLYQGPRNPRSGAQIYPGFVPGSEAAPQYTGKLVNAYGWTMIQGPLARQYAIPLLKNMVFGKKWNWKSFDFDRDVARVDHAVHSDIDATDPNLRPFQAHGGKLIMTQGWGDPYNAQTYPIEYRAQVIAVFAAREGQREATKTVDGFYRLFMAPGMGHCLGGPGPSRIDALSAVRAWVETGKAPDKLVARTIHFPGEASTPPMSRPLCPYPQIARWTGKGSTNKAKNFVCTMPKHAAKAQ